MAFDVQTEHRRKPSNKVLGKDMASTWETRRTWEGCLEEVKWRGPLKGKWRC